MSGHFPTGRVQTTCVMAAWSHCVKARNVTANTRVAFANTQRVSGIVTQSSPILYIYGMYIYICYYTLRVSSKSTQRHTHRRDHHMQ